MSIDLNMLKNILSFRLTSLIVFSIVFSINGFSQFQRNPTTFQSPNAATLGLFGDVPVSYFTGLPTIDIPLFTYKDNSLSMPISLSYHASGFRPDMHPGWVGLGWNLSCTYAITRTINDIADDYNNSAIGPQWGYFYNYNILASPSWNQVSYMHSIAVGAKSIQDTEPDEYSFNYPGGSGKFYLDHNRQWRVKSDKPIKVSFDNLYYDVPFAVPSGSRRDAYGNTKSFAGFTLTDEFGVQYVYGMNPSAIEYRMGFFAQWLDEWLAQAWYLTKIIQPEGQFVTFNYERDDFINQMYISVNDDILTTVSHSAGAFLSTSCSITGWKSLSAYYNGMLVSPVYLTNISGSNTKIIFKRSTSSELNYPSTIYNPRLTEFRSGDVNSSFLPELDQDNQTDLQGLALLKFKKLDTIQIVLTSGGSERNFVFGFNNIDTERLTLKTINELGQNNETKPPYQFVYDNSLNLPPYLANKTDHWGFYNGTEATIDKANYYFSYYSKREPSASLLYAGTLTKIVYPTWGVTDLIYEPHTYRRRLYERRSLGIDLSYSQNTLAGGLRIKKIVSYDIISDSIKKTREFLYHVAPGAGVSSGILGGRVRYYFDDYRMIPIGDPNTVYSNSFFSSQSVLPGCINSIGSPVGYSIVQENLSDGSYSKYYFTNFDNGAIDDGADTTLQPTHTAYEPYASTEEERGKLYKQEDFSNLNVLLRKREITYTSLNKANEYVRAVKCRSFFVCPTPNLTEGDEGTAYKIYTYSYLPKQDISTQYDQNGTNPIVTSKYYTYHSTLRLLTKDSAIDSKNQTIQTYYRYPFDVMGYTYTPPASLNMPICYMVQHNIIGRPSEIIKTRKILGSEEVIGSVATIYKNYSGSVHAYQSLEFKYPGSSILKSAYTNYSVALASGVEVTTRDSRLELKTVVDNYDVKGNITDIRKDQDINSAYQWGYTNTFVTAKVLNGHYGTNKDFFYNGFEEDGTAATSTPFAGLKYKSGDYTVLYTVPSGGLYYINYRALQSGIWTSITKPFSNSMILTEGDAIDEVRVYSSNSQMWTYTFDIIKGPTSETDNTGNTRFFNYDGLGRLISIKDEKFNILKQYSYNYEWWQPTGASQCMPCPSNTNTISNVLQVQYRDNNPSSPTYNQLKWVDAGPSTRCVPPTNYQNTALPLRCQTNEIGQITGKLEQQQKDINPCSLEYNYTKWVIASVDTITCPVNRTSIMLTTNNLSVNIGTIQFAGSAGTYVFDLYPNVSSYELGRIPYGIYTITIILNSFYYFKIFPENTHGYGYGGTTEKGIITPQWGISISNAYIP